MGYWGNRDTPSVGVGLEGIELQVENHPQIKTQREERTSKAGVTHVRGVIMWDKWLPVLPPEDSNGWPAGQTALATNRKHFSQMGQCWLHLSTCWYFQRKNHSAQCPPTLRECFPAWEKLSSGWPLPRQCELLLGWEALELGSSSDSPSYQVWPLGSWHLLWGSNVTLRYLVPEFSRAVIY